MRHLQFVTWHVAAGLLSLALFSRADVAYGKSAPGYSLDGITLSVTIKEVIATRGKPQRQDGYKYTWENAAGGTTEVTTLDNGVVVEIDVKGGPREVRNVSLPAFPPQTYAVLGQSGHVNYRPPEGSRPSGLCEDLGLSGKPCEAFTLPGWGSLVVNFGVDVGLAEGSLSEIILAAPGFLDKPVSTISPPPRQTFPGVTPGMLTKANLTLTASGCGARAIRKEPISISVWPSNWYPGVGDEVARTKTRDKAVFRVQPGYYRFMLGGSGCWEEMQWLVLLPGHDRNATLSFKSFDAKPGVDYDIYYAQHGGVGGTIPPNVTNVVLRPLSKDSKSKSPVVITEPGVYYADFVPEGSYILEAKRFGKVDRKNITVKNDRLEIVNFTESDFPR